MTTFLIVLLVVFVALRLIIARQRADIAQAKKEMREELEMMEREDAARKARRDGFDIDATTAVDLRDDTSV